MTLGPFLITVMPGVVILLISWWFNKANFSFFIRLMPGILTTLASIIWFYFVFVNAKGFEKGVYDTFGLFLIIYAIISLAMAEKSTRESY